MRTYFLTPHESITVVDHSPERLLVDVRYEPDGKAPPAHFHPEQDEAFECVSGTIGVRVGRAMRVLTPGDVLQIPRGTPHSMWNAGTTPAVAHWAISPPGRTMEWFQLLDRYQRAHRQMPGLLTFAAYLRAYPDVFRLAGPSFVVSPLMGALSGMARLRGVSALPT